VRLAPVSDSRRVTAIAFLFSHGLGVNTVVLPLVALAAGHSNAAVGVLVACSAGAQISMRVALAHLLHRFSERVMLVTSAVLLVFSSAAVLVWQTLAVFVVAQVLQGLARGFFWIGLQAQVVRTAEDSLGPLARVDFMSGIGLATGPATIALVGGSLSITLVVGLATTALSVWPMVRLEALPLFQRGPSDVRVRVWRRPGVPPALLAGIATGLWRGLLSSYIPVTLTVAGYSPSTVGVLVGVATGASILGSLTAGLTGNRRPRAVVITSALGTAGGLVGVGLNAQSLSVVVVGLVFSGLGAGTLQTFGSALSARAVEPRLRGRVVAEVGTYRAGALFGAPLGVAALLLLIPVGPAMAVVGLFAVLPAFARWYTNDVRLPQHSPDETESRPADPTPGPTTERAPKRGLP
jgi:MFS family permease